MIGARLGQSGSLRATTPGLFGQCAIGEQDGSVRRVGWLNGSDSE
jgi:hypothetical protein